MPTGTVRRALNLALLATACVVMPAGADPPPLRIVVGSTAGGPVDLLARLFRDAAAAKTGASAHVENRPGAAGTVAAQSVATSTADGRTVLVAGMGSTVAAPHLFSNLRYRPSQDLRPVTLLATSGLVLVVPVEGPRSVRELAMRERPADRGEVLYASSGLGSANHLCAEDFALRAGFAARSIPFHGDAHAQASVVQGDVAFMFMAPNVAMPLERAGRLRILATTGRLRAPALRQVPTVAEAGFPGFECLAWAMVFVPSHTPDAAATALARAWMSSLEEPRVRAAIEASGMQPPASASPDEAERLLDAERARLGRLLAQRARGEALSGSGDQKLRQ